MTAPAPEPAEAAPTETEPAETAPKTLNRRSQLKATRRADLVRAAARLIAERGFASVRLEDIGAAAGISGPAVYRHFPSKEAVLLELLSTVSQHLFEGGTAVVENAADAPAALGDLVEFHLDFALGQPDLIRVHDRDLHSLPDEARHHVRMTQRRYVEKWVDVLRELDPGLDAATARAKAHAVFGLMNSTPHSAKSLSKARTRELLRAMARAALAAHP